MSQTETLLLVVLGFALAALVGLFVGRLVWVTALRLGARRLQKQVPSNLVDLQTERDRLRAEYAMLSQRLSSRIEAIKLAMAEQMAEVSRHRNRLETADAELASKSAEMERLHERIHQLEAAAATAARTNETLAASLSARDGELAAAQEIIRRMQAAGPHTGGDEARSDAIKGGLAERIARLNTMAQTVATERARVTRDAALKPTADPALLEKLEEARRETSDIQKELERLDAEWSKRLDELPKREGEVANAPKRAVANVISLANRIRALQKDINGG